MEIKSQLESLFLSYFGHLPESMVPITGSGSNRNYFRMTSAGDSCIGVHGIDPDENRAFIYLSRHFRDRGIDVPEVFLYSEDSMCYIQEDLGSVHLYDMVAEAGKASGGGDDSWMRIEGILCTVMKELARIQFDGAQGLDFERCYPEPSFNRRMVMFDLNYFKYCFLKATGTEFNEIALQDDFERFADALLSEDSDSFMYRDFQSRNVMVRDGVPYFIDFQGGRKGPVYYDVASFVYHSRSAFPEWLRENMLKAYLDAASGYVRICHESFREKLRMFILFRTLQVLGAYGFRGWMEHKANFVTSISAAASFLRDFLSQPLSDYPYLNEVLLKMLDRPVLAPRNNTDGRLLVTVTSFSYKKGIPEDPSGNGGGYVFDCRSIHNPGRYEMYKKLTGMDVPVIRFLEDDGEITGFLSHVYGVVDPHVETFIARGFDSLMVSFGCTGGQHRSVYCAEHLAKHLIEKYSGIEVRLVHREQGVDKYMNRL